MIRLALAKLRATFAKQRLDHEFAQELDTHFEALVEEHVRKGLTVPEARRAARLKLGPPAELAQMHREQRGLPWLDATMHDFRYAVRGLGRNWGLTAAAVVSVALGTGANTAVFSLMDQAVFRMLPVPDPQELVLLNPRGPSYGNPQGGRSISHPLYKDIGDRAGVFSGVFARQLLPAHTGYQGQTERVWAEMVTGTYFETLGVRAHLGRLITPEDDRAPGAHPVGVLSFGYWQSRFDSDREITGRTIHLNGHPFTIIGVSAKGFDGLDLHLSPQVRVPTMMRAVMSPLSSVIGDRGSQWLNVYARLKPGVTRRQARESLQPLYRGLLEMESKEQAFAKASPERIERLLKGTLELQPAGHPEIGNPSRVRQVSIMLMSVVAVVLLIACANIANLLLARGTARQKEIAIRLAVGASRSRLVRQLLMESMLLAVAGGIAGLVVAHWTMRGALQFAPAEVIPVIKPALDQRVLMFDLALSLLTGLLFGLIPALKSTRPDVSPTLKDQAGSLAGDGSSHWLRKCLVVAQVSLSLALVVTALLLVHSLRNLRNHNTGFLSGNLLSFALDPRLDGYGYDRSLDLRSRLKQRLAALPGVEGVTFSQYQVLGGDYLMQTAHTDAASPVNASERWTFCDRVDSSYLPVLGLPLIRGRGFEPRDQTGGSSVALVNESFARRHFRETNPVGRRFGFDPSTAMPFEVVGVVKDASYAWIRSEGYEPLAYLPMPDTAALSPLTFYLRVKDRPNLLLASVRRAVSEIDANLPLHNFRSMEQQIDERLALERISATFSSWFGIIATVLALVGLYGVMAYVVAGRTREIGVRMALGAASGRVLRLVMGEAMPVVGIGAGIGLALAAAISRSMKSMLFGVPPNDPTTFFMATALLLFVAAAAAMIPAWRASRIDAIRALREE